MVSQDAPKPKRSFFGSLFGKHGSVEEAANREERWLVTVARLSDIPPGATLRIELSAADARRAELLHRTRGRLAWEPQRAPAIGLTNVDGQLYAYADACPHQHYSLAESAVEGTQVNCTLHAWCYDISTGAPVPPVKIGLPTYRVVVEGDTVRVDVRKRTPQMTTPDVCVTAFDSIAHAPVQPTPGQPPLITRTRRDPSRT